MLLRWVFRSPVGLHSSSRRNWLRQALLGGQSSSVAASALLLLLVSFAMFASSPVVVLRRHLFTQVGSLRRLIVRRDLLRSGVCASFSLGRVGNHRLSRRRPAAPSTFAFPRPLPVPA